LAGLINIKCAKGSPFRGIDASRNDKTNSDPSSPGESGDISKEDKKSQEGKSTGECYIALISDDSQLKAVEPILNELNKSSQRFDDNRAQKHIFNQEVLNNHNVIIWYKQSTGSTSKDEVNQINKWIEGGGRIIITGDEVMCCPIDENIAELLRVKRRGTSINYFSLVVKDASHPIMNGPYGAWKNGDKFKGTSGVGDCESNEGPGVKTIATASVSEIPRIVVTSNIGDGGIIVFWNGNSGAKEWTGEGTSKELGKMFKNTIHWLCEE
jgi:hypothetical protein